MGKGVSMPSSYGGIVRYFEEYKSKIELKPDHIVFIAIVSIIVVIALHAINPLGF